MTDYSPTEFKVGRINVKTWTYKQGRGREVFISSPKWRIHLSGLLMVNRLKKLPPGP